MCWHISSLVTTRSGRNAPTLSNPTFVGPLVAAICVIYVLGSVTPTLGIRSAHCRFCSVAQPSVNFY